jgi:CheY-like chemotaxis protein/HPt (histidine-containing phosphotransfer) domain-containing protein
MMTAFGREEVMQQAESLGVDGFLIKPIKLSVLFDTLMGVFGGQRDAPRTRVRPVEEAPVQGRLRGRRVLVVEDNFINRQVATEMLAVDGISVETAENGKAAVAALRKGRFDAVLMDIQMPEMDGYQASRTIRRDPRHRELPIIAMTAHALKGDREKCLDAGMNDYVTKPVNSEELLAVLSQWMSPEPVARGETGEGASGRETGASRPPDLPALPEVAGIDLPAGIDRLGGNRSLFMKLLASFADDHRTIGSSVREALRRGDIQEAIHQVHTLKGVAGNLSADGLARTAARLERRLRESGEADPGLLEAFEAAVRQVLDGIGRLREGAVGAPDGTDERGSGGSEAAEFDNPGLHGRVNLLDRQLLANDLEAEETVKALMPLLEPGSEEEAMLSRVEGHIEGLDFSGARQEVAEMARRLSVRLEASGNVK